MWNFFGGGIKEEEDVITTAIRETFEELNIYATEKDFEIESEITESEAGHVYIVKLKKIVNWNDIVLNEGAGIGFFTPEEILEINSTKVTRLFVRDFLLNDRL